MQRRRPRVGVVEWGAQEKERKKYDCKPPSATRPVSSDCAKQTKPRIRLKHSLPHFLDLIDSPPLQRAVRVYWRAEIPVAQAQDQ
jgi:hypothetical protein